MPLATAKNSVAHKWKGFSGMSANIVLSLTLSEPATHVNLGCCYDISEQLIHMKRGHQEGLRRLSSDTFDIARNLWRWYRKTIWRLFLWGYRTTIARYVGKWGIAQMCLCETKD